MAFRTFRDRRLRQRVETSGQPPDVDDVCLDELPVERLGGGFDARDDDRLAGFAATELNGMVREKLEQ